MKYFILGLIGAILGSFAAWKNGWRGVIILYLGMAWGYSLALLFLSK